MTEKLQPKDTLSPKSSPMRLNDLTDSILDDIVAIYDEVASSEAAREFIESGDSSQKVEYVLEMLDFSNAAEWRFGSELSQDTKLFIWKAGGENDSYLIRFAFDPNWGVSDPEGKRKSEFDAITNAFRDRVDEYLSAHHLSKEN